MARKVRQTGIVFIALISFFILLGSPQAAELLPDTGQTRFYDNSGEISKPAPGEPFYGQDAHYIKTRSHTKFDAQGNILLDSASTYSMVQDNVTRLIWEVKQDLDLAQNYRNAHDADNTYTWDDTGEFINSLNRAGYGGFSDWRLPTIMELSQLVDAGNDHISITTDFFSLLSSRYWSSTTCNDVMFSMNAWIVNFKTGEVLLNAKGDRNHVCAVRSERPQASEPLVNNGDGTITDPNTDLMWQQVEAERMTWQDALAYCEKLKLAGYDNWRLPDRLELQSLVDYHSYNPCLDKTLFPGISASDYYWSSTTDINHVDSAWVVDFTYGYVIGTWFRKADSLHLHEVRAVRSTQGKLLPGTPSLTVTTSGTKITVGWNAVTNATGYTLYYAPYPELSYIGSIDMETTLGFSVDLPLSSAFYIAAQAYNAEEQGNLSNIEHFIISSTLTGKRQADLTIDCHGSATHATGTDNTHGTEWFHVVIPDGDSPITIKGNYEHSGSLAGGYQLSGPAFKYGLVKGDELILTAGEWFFTGESMGRVELSPPVHIPLKNGVVVNAEFITTNPIPSDVYCAYSLNNIRTYP